MQAQVAYEEQIVQTVRKLPLHRRLEALRMLQELENAEEREKEAERKTEKEKDDELNLPRFMQNMIEAGILELSNLDAYVKSKSTEPQVSLEEFRRRLREKGITVPVEEYIRAERSKR